MKICYEILQPDKGSGVRDRPVLQAQQYTIAERIADQCCQKQQWRGHHQPAENALAVEPSAEIGATTRRPYRPDESLGPDRHGQAPTQNANRNSNALLVTPAKAGVRKLEFVPEKIL